MRFRRFRLALLPLAALSTALALAPAGCGGNDEDARKQLDAAFKKPIKSANVTIDLEAKLDGLPLGAGAFKARLTGAYKNNGSDQLPSLDLDISITGIGRNVEAGLVSTPGNLFVILEDQAYEAGERAVKEASKDLDKRRKESKEDDQSLAKLGINPANWVVDAENEGDKEIGGVETEHITAKIEVGKLLDDANKLVESAPSVSSLGVRTPQKLTEDQKDELNKFVKDPTIDVYIGKDDGIVRRVSFDVEIDVPEDQQEGLRGFAGGDFSLSAEFRDVGKPVTITPPKNAKPFRDLRSQLLGGLGGLQPGGAGSSSPRPQAPERDSGSSGSGTPGSGDSGGSTTPDLGSGGSANPQDAKKFQEYLECVQDAGADQNKLTNCTQQLQ